MSTEGPMNFGYSANEPSKKPSGSRKRVRVRKYDDPDSTQSDHELKQWQRRNQRIWLIYGLIVIVVFFLALHRTGIFSE